MWQRLIIALFCVAGAFVQAQSIGALTPYEASYKVRMKGLSGELSMTLRAEDDGFSARSVIEPRGLARLFAGGQLEETSRFERRGDGLRPLGYRSADTLSRSEETSHIDFNWQAGTATGSDEDGDFQHELDDGSFDRLSIQFALMQALARGTTEFDYAMLDGARYKPLNVEVLGEENVKTPYGKFDTIAVRHQAEGSSRATTLWCAPQLGFLPVKIEQHRKGKRIVRAVLTDYGS